MDRPILVIVQNAGQPLELAYLGTDSVAAEKCYEELAAKAAVDAVAIYYYPQARMIAYPATLASINQTSKACQSDPHRERIFAEAKSKALARLTAEKKTQLEAEAQAEAEAAAKAYETAQTAVANVVARATTVESAEQAVVDEIAKAAQAQADAEAGPAEQAEPESPANHFGAASPAPEPLAPTPPRRAKRS